MVTFDVLALFEFLFVSERDLTEAFDLASDFDDELVARFDNP